MKTIQTMKKMSFVILSVMMSAVFSLSTLAAQIDADSELAVFGTYSPTGGTDLVNATGLAFPASVLIAGGVKDFAFSVGGSANFSAFDFNPASPGPILTFANGGAFTAAAIVTDLQTTQSLDLTLEGIWSLNGFDDTRGRLVLTADALGGVYTFSASGTVSPLLGIRAVPLPGAILLFASALASLGLLSRRTASK